MHSRTNAYIYGPAWISKARNSAPAGSWASDLLQNILGCGQGYLETIRTWFQQYPAAADNLKNRLESLDDQDHFGAANELFWLELIKTFLWTASPVATAGDARPDFHVTRPLEFFCEVTTLNLSEQEKEALEFYRDLESRNLSDEEIAALEMPEALKLDHQCTIRRILRKAASEKKDQLDYGLKQRCPSILVLFDYTSWSSLPTYRYLALFEDLIERDGFGTLPKSLSAIVYVKKKFCAERFWISLDGSVAYHNPHACRRLPSSLFTMIRQYDQKGNEMPSSDSRIRGDAWICL